MKKIGLLLLAFFGGMMVFAAEFPDFSQPETWKKAAWRKSVYIRGEKGVLKIDRTQPGSGAWRSKTFAVTVGEKLRGSVDVAYLKQDGKGAARMGFNFLGADGKRVVFRNVVWMSKPNSGFETKGFSFVVPEGAVKAEIYLCLDGAGSAEFNNLAFKK